MLHACTCKTPDSDRRSYCKESKSYWSPVRVVIILLTICGGLWRILISTLRSCSPPHGASNSLHYGLEWFIGFVRESE